jgi:hypothetical protein
MAQLTVYETPVGTFNTWEEAADACERADMDACECVEIVRPEYIMVLTEMLPDGSQPIRLSNAIMCF